MNSQRYILLFEAFRSTTIPKVINFLKSKGIRYGEFLQRLRDLNKSDFRIDIANLKDSDFEYYNYKKASKVISTENTLFKFWFSNDKGYIGMSVTTPQTVKKILHHTSSVILYNGKKVEKLETIDKNKMKIWLENGGSFVTSKVGKLSFLEPMSSFPSSMFEKEKIGKTFIKLEHYGEEHSLMAYIKKINIGERRSKIRQNTDGSTKSDKVVFDETYNEALLAFVKKSEAEKLKKLESIDVVPGLQNDLYKKGEVEEIDFPSGYDYFFQIGGSDDGDYGEFFIDGGDVIIYKEIDGFSLMDESFSDGDFVSSYEPLSNILKDNADFALILRDSDVPKVHDKIEKRKELKSDATAFQTDREIRISNLERYISKISPVKELKSLQKILTLGIGGKFCLFSGNNLEADYESVYYSLEAASLNFEADKEFKPVRLQNNILQLYESYYSFSRNANQSYKNFIEVKDELNPTYVKYVNHLLSISQKIYESVKNDEIDNVGILRVVADKMDNLNRFLDTKFEPRIPEINGSLYGVIKRGDFKRLSYSFHLDEEEMEKEIAILKDVVRRLF